MLGTVVLVVGAIAAIIGLMAVWWTVGHLTGRPLDADDFPTFGPVADTALTLLVVAVLLPVVLLAAFAVQARPVGTLSSVCGRLRWRWLAECLLPALLAVGLLLAGMAGFFALAGETVLPGAESLVDAGTLAVSLVMLVVLVPVQAAAEEYLCRGWLLQAVGVFLRTPWPGIAVQAVVFATLHGWGTPWGFIDLCFFGAALGWLTVRTGGLEAAIAWHVVNNLAFMGLAAAFGQLADQETAADAGWQLLPVDVLAITAYVLVVDRLARRRRIARTVPAAPVGPPTTPAPALP
ncbi:CAAX protease self-immunity [Micromonospora auratinigra]|uniref:CAAX protease self-immunity n=1 Tax=Micromonospora auratinigra TaxID=261654 RepID=A0A1A8Z0S5_9ACTN|nr:CAAX protease self-immunity [Micromonospora auratinigra]